MAPVLRALQTGARKTRQPPREFSRVAPILSATTQIEEETLPYYKPGHYCPVKIGDVYHSRYEIEGKPAYVPPTQILSGHEYTVLKVSTALPDQSTATDREFRVYENLTNPMHMTLLQMVGLNPEPFNLSLLQMTVKRLLLALDFLYAEAGVIYTDLKTDNLMLSLEDKIMLTDFATAEAENPSPREAIDHSHIIYSYHEGQNWGAVVLPSMGRAKPATALIGPPPSEFVRRSETTEQCFDPSIWSLTPVPTASLATLEKRLGGEEKELFLAFMLSMLKWMPEERKTAKQLLEHPFMLLLPTTMFLTFMFYADMLT
ncbi:hypothetical protein BDW62DRAFT_215274 [Aspergillus aurantiobrunneus]